MKAYNLLKILKFFITSQIMTEKILASGGDQTHVPNILVKHLNHLDH